MAASQLPQSLELMGSGKLDIHSFLLWFNSFTQHCGLCSFSVFEARDVAGNKARGAPSLWRKTMAKADP